MLERRNSARLPLAVKVRETNGDYLYTWTAANFGEEGLFLANKVCITNQEPYSRLSFTLPGGPEIHNVLARIVRENRRAPGTGCAYELLNLSEEDRMSLKRFFLSRVAS